MSAAGKILEKMRRTKGGWKPNDLERLYRGFGFTMEEGGNHTIYSHPQFPQLRATVGRHRVLATGYIETALSLIDRLAALKAEEEARRVAEEARVQQGAGGRE